MTIELPDWIVPFEEWSLRGRWWPVTRRPTSKPNIASIVHHAVTDTTGRSPFEQIQDIEEIIYRRRIRSRFSMIAYSWPIATDGTVFAGRAHVYRNGANNDTKRTGFTNSNTSSICFAGNYEPGAGPPVLIPTEAQLRSAARVIAWERSVGLMVDVSPVKPHSDVHKTACCGLELRTRIPKITEYLNEVQEQQAMGPYVHQLPDGTFDVVMPGRGRTRVSDATHWAERCRIAAQTGIFASPYMAALLDEDRHVDFAEEIAGNIDPFRPDTVDAPTIDETKIADAVLARFRAALSKG